MFLNHGFIRNMILGKESNPFVRQITSNVVSKPKKGSRSEEILIKTLKRRVMELEKENKKLQNKIQKLYGELYNKE